MWLNTKNKEFLLIFQLLILISLNVTAQSKAKYNFKYKEDTFSINLTQEELITNEYDRNLSLNKVGKKKKKKLREGTHGTVKLIFNDTLFTVSFIDFFDDYFIGFLAKKKDATNKKSNVLALGYRRIKYADIRFIQTNGHNTTLPILSVGLIGFTAGLTISIRAILGTINPLFLPVGLGITYLSSMLVESRSTKRYYINSEKTKKIYAHMSKKYNHNFDTWQITLNEQNRL